MTPNDTNPRLKLLLDFGPLAVFFLTFRFGGELLGIPSIHGLLEPVTGAKALAGKNGPLFLATAAFMIASLAALKASWWLNRHIPRMMLVTTVVVGLFGGLTLWLQDDTFIKMKPTIAYGVFSVILGFGLLRGRSYLKSLMGTSLPLDDAGWIIFTQRWVLFFVFMAALNEVVWRTQSTELWVTFKTFAAIPLTFLFLAMQWPLLKRHMVEEE